MTWIAGAGGFDGTVELAGVGEPPVESDDTFLNGYGYVKLRSLGPVEITAGASVESVDAPVGYLPPRDSNILAADLSYSKTDISPKLGITAILGRGTTLRAGAYHRLAPYLGRLQTLEPTQVAGFNQFYEDSGGTRSWNYGAGIDQAFGRRWFLGASYLVRDLTVPEAYCDREDPTQWSQFAGCAGSVPSVIEERSSDERLLTVYASAAPWSWLAITIAYDDEEREFDTTSVTLTGAFQDRFRTERLRPKISFYTPRGFFARAGGARYDQEVDQFDDLDPETRVTTTVESAFWVADAAVGYRFPKRFGSFVVDARNVFNKKFEFYERRVQERVIPARTIMARLEITF
jgi:hypothetical protein